jgi:hypothetical protein
VDISTEGRRATDVNAQRTYQQQERLAALEGELAGVDQSNRQKDISAENTNAERQYTYETRTAEQQTAIDNELARERARLTNAEIDASKPTAQITEKGITVTKRQPDGSLEIQHTPLKEADDTFKRIKQMQEMLGKSDAASQIAAYGEIGKMYGSAGIKHQLLTDMAEQGTYGQVFGKSKAVMDRLKSVTQEAMKLAPPAIQADPKKAAEVQSQAVKNELMRMYQSGQLGEEWIGALAQMGHVGAGLLVPRSAVPAAAPTMPSGLGQGAAFQ